MHLLREISAQLSNAGQPIVAALLRDQLDVQEGALLGSKVLARRDATHDARRNIRHRILVERKRLGDREAPALFVGPSDHGRRRGRWRRCEAEGILEAKTAHLDGQIDEIDVGVEQWDFGWCVEWKSLRWTILIFK